MKVKYIKKLSAVILALALTASVGLTGCGEADSGSGSSGSKTTAEESKSGSSGTQSNKSSGSSSSKAAAAGLSSVYRVKNYDGSPYKAVRGNKPNFKKSELKAKSVEKYGRLDSLGRCQTCFAIVSRSTMPTEKRGSIGSVKPTGWQITKYSFVDGRYLYNRCHLIAYQLTAENANERNLITGTRYMNVDGMLPFENMVADYVKETGNHVAYKVTPIFRGDDLVAQGVHMMAQSVEDKGRGISYNIFCYNVQPGVTIDYKTGKNHLAKKSSSSVKNNSSKSSGSSSAKVKYVINKNTGVFHLPTCSSVSQMKKSNRKYVTATRKSMIASGYDPCSVCRP
ncbi:MAG: DNA/RNA non-specific endonuclease [Eubacteriales bacterium]|nr:DNA/RNA non-specific endonuclease [Eubacteriales bacterium]